MKFLDQVKIYVKLETVGLDHLVLEEKNLLNLEDLMEVMEEKVVLLFLCQREI